VLAQHHKLLEPYAERLVGVVGVVLVAGSVQSGLNAHALILEGCIKPLQSSKPASRLTPLPNPPPHHDPTPHQPHPHPQPHIDVVPVVRLVRRDRARVQIDGPARVDPELSERAAALQEGPCRGPVLALLQEGEAAGAAEDVEDQQVLVGGLVGWLGGWEDWLVGWLVGGLVGLVGGLVGWLEGLVGWLGVWGLGLGLRVWCGSARGSQG